MVEVKPMMKVSFASEGKIREKKPCKTSECTKMGQHKKRSNNRIALASAPQGINDLQIPQRAMVTKENGNLLGIK